MHATNIKLSERIRQFYESAHKKINARVPLVEPKFMKGRLDNRKYSNVKRTIDENPECGKKVKITSFQVEVSDLPLAWIREGTNKITAVADAYGDDGEKATEMVYQKSANTFVVVFKREKYAHKLYDNLNHREIDDCMVKVSVPHTVE